MIDRTTNLAAALRANSALRVQAERLIAEYVEAGCNRAAIINDLIHLFDGPRQSEPQRLVEEALDQADDSTASRGRLCAIDSWEA
jgi:hypothetical protein